MNKLLTSVIAPCITFGPLFMTRIAGSARADVGNGLVFAGVMMLATGLVLMMRIIASQQKLIEGLKVDRRNDA